MAYEERLMTGAGERARNLQAPSHVACSHATVAVATEGDPHAPQT